MLKDLWNVPGAIVSEMKYGEACVNCSGTDRSCVDHFHWRSRESKFSDQTGPLIPEKWVPPQVGDVANRSHAWEDVDGA